MSLQLQIECTNVCNADCVFCPYGKMQRAKGTMPMPLFRKIVDEAATIPLISHITITGLGEPLLDRHLLERLRYIRAKLPHILLDMYTNGTYLRKKVVDDLIDVGLSVLYISLNGVDAQKRREIMKVDDYDEVVEYIKYAKAATAGTGTRVLVKGIVSKDLMEAGDQETFANQWGGRYSPESKQGAYLHLEGNWAGKVWPMRVTPTQACSRALSQIMVLQDGRVSLCCFDSEGEMVLGDLNHQSLREIYGGPLALGIREAHNDGRRSEIALCKNCTGI